MGQTLSRFGAGRYVARPYPLSREETQAASFAGAGDMVDEVPGPKKR